MDDLVRVTAEHELAGAPHALQDQGELDIRQVLHLVHHDKVIARLTEGEQGVGDQVEIVHAGVVEERQVLAEELVHPGALCRSKNGAADAEPQVVRLGEIRLVEGGAGQHAAELLEQLVRVRHAVARDPPLELAKVEGAPPGHPDALEILLEGQELDGLLRVLIPERVVESARVLHQEGGAGDIQDVTGEPLQPFEAEHGLPAAGGANQDAGRAEAERLGLRLVKRQDLVEQVEVPARRVHVPERQRLVLGYAGRVGQGHQFLLVDGGAAEKPGGGVGMVPDDLDEQDVPPAATGGQPEQQPVGRIELGAVVRRRRELPHLRPPEITCPEVRNDSVELGRDRRGVQFVEL